MTTVMLASKNSEKKQPDTKPAEEPAAPSSGAAPPKPTIIETPIKQPKANKLLEDVFDLECNIKEQSDPYGTAAASNPAAMDIVPPPPFA